MASRVEIPQPTTATTHAEADKAVRETAHLFANSHLPFAKRWDLARVHEHNVAVRDSLKGGA